MAPATTPPNTFTFTYDAARDCLLGHWLAPTADQPLRAHYTSLLAAAQAHGSCRFWLLDLRGRNWHTPEFGRWYSEVFAAAAHAALHQAVFVAYVLSPLHYMLACSPPAEAMQQDCATHEVYPFFFEDEAAAHEWLAYQQSFSQPS